MSLAQLNLFEPVDSSLEPIWNTAPVKAFEEFVRTRRFAELGQGAKRRDEDGRVKPLHSGSVKIYEFMFRKFSRWLQRNHVAIHEVTGAHICLFLNHDSFNMSAVRQDVKAHQNDNEASAADRDAPESEIRQRYLGMLNRVFSHLSVTPNPASEGQQRGKDSPKQFLDAAEQASFWAALPACAPWTPNESPKEWKKRRNRAMFALMLGAGLTVSEVICLYRVNIGRQLSDGSVPVTVWAPNVDGAPAREGTGFTHVTMLRSFAVKEVVNWLAERDAKYPVGSGRAFPAGVTEEQIDLLVDKSTLYRHVKATLRAAGVDAARQGGRTLRNTYAREELARGTSIDTLREYLGLSKCDSIDAYRPASEEI
jgi:hypothetical protein